MAAETFTVGELLERLAWIVEGRNSADTTLRPNYLQALQHSMMELVLDVDLPAFRKDGTITTAASTEDYNLDDDFKRIIEPSVKFTTDPKDTICYKSHQEWDRFEYDRLTNGKPRYFTISECDSSDGIWHIRFRPIPDAAYTIKYRFFQWPAMFDDDTDGTTVVDRRFPARYKRAIVAGAVVTGFPERMTGTVLSAQNAIFEKAKMQIRKHGSPVVGNVHQRERFSTAPRGVLRPPADAWTGGTGKTPGWG